MILKIHYTKAIEFGFIFMTWMLRNSINLLNSDQRDEFRAMGRADRVWRESHSKYHLTEMIRWLQRTRPSHASGTWNRWSV
ncbi:hypothetical protein DSO57_1021201 [Entomophthora muscae]|uniref:Uncharacterized protein n=1 Tax=Entomophthora muscae TaxID=34485 RepID=A0ACC2U225_9FUNG|nr:hypothetical protein DSO57_1021201 [Entomophthora muscae]